MKSKCLRHIAIDRFEVSDRSDFSLDLINTTTLSNSSDEFKSDIADSIGKNGYSFTYRRFSDHIEYHLIFDEKIISISQVLGLHNMHSGVVRDWLLTKLINLNRQENLEKLWK